MKKILLSMAMGFCLSLHASEDASNQPPKGIALIQKELAEGAAREAERQKQKLCTAYLTIMDNSPAMYEIDYVSNRWHSRKIKDTCAAVLHQLKYGEGNPTGNNFVASMHTHCNYSTTENNFSNITFDQAKKIVENATQQCYKKYDQ